MILRPAENLDEAWQTLSTRPLVDRGQFDAFYRGDLNAVRGEDQVMLMARRQRLSFGSTFYKTFLMGHPGVGKSTEMTRLSQIVEPQFRVIRFSAQTDLDASGFRPFDVLLAMMIRVSEETARPIDTGGAGKQPSRGVVADIWRWFSTERQTVTPRTHLVFAIPIALAYSERAAQLPLPQIPLPDTPVFDRGHAKHVEGRAALAAVLTARILPSLFDAGQMDRLIVASGGNLRDLFDMCEMAAITAASRAGSTAKIGPAEVTAAIRSKRTDYVRQLGTSPFDAQSMSWAAKADRLAAIYHQKPDHDIPDPVLHSLLRARAVQEFDGERWFGVHPLVVDILKSHGRLKGRRGEAVPGGTD